MFTIKTKQTVSFHCLIYLAYQSSYFSGCGQNGFLSGYIPYNYRVTLTCIETYLETYFSNYWSFGFSFSLLAALHPVTSFISVHDVL